MESIINSFNKGLNKDFNLNIQPDGTYRELINCQLVSQGGNNYVIKDCLGNTRMFTINPPYSGTIATVGALPMVICFISFPNKLIVISTNNQASGGYGEIGKIEFLPYGEGIQPKSIAGQYNSGYIPLYHSVSLNLTQQHRAEGFSYVENELIERIYWTDNYNEPRSFNISNPIFTDYIASGSLIIGESYMVLEGAIRHPTGGGNPIYGPGLTASNVFEATATTYTNLTGTTPSPKVIKYFPYQLLDFTPSRKLSSITFKEYGTGNLFCGNKVYFYRLGSATASITSSWSYGSSPVPVGTQNVNEYLTSVPYHNFVGAGTENALVNSGLSVIITLSNIDTNYDYIEVACAEFDESSSIPRQITIINRVNITDENIEIEHNGLINLGALTLSDITLFPASILKVKTLSTNKNYLLGGNFTERQELDIDLSAAASEVFLYPLNVHYDAQSCSLSGMIYRIKKT